MNSLHSNNRSFAFAIFKGAGSRNVSKLLSKRRFCSTFDGPPFMKDIFAEGNTGYNLRHGNDSQVPKVHITTYGIETISFLGNRLSSTLPNIFKQASTLPIFKNHIKFWKGESCNCRLCKIYIPQAGYLT